MATVGFVGLGTMGAPMAGHLIEGGFETVVWNRTAAKAQQLVSQGASAAGSLANVAEQCEVVFLCVARSEDVDECLSAMEPSAKSGALFVDHSTIAPDAAISFHQRLQGKGLRFLDAPITGGSMGAQSGQLTVFVGGEKSNYLEALPMMQCYSRRAELVGGPGAGQTMKMANQIAVGGSLLGLCESLAFAKKAGLDIVQTRKLLSQGAAGSWAFDNYGPKILEGDWSPGFTIDNQRKDFAYCKGTAEKVGAAVPGTELVDELLAILDAEGHGDWTTAALYELLARGERGP